MAEAADTPLSMIDLKPPPSDMQSEVLAGLMHSPKSIAPKFFYDARGSALFERITALPEYYPTRTEIGILRTHGADIAAAAGPEKLLIEFGSGSSAKIRLLLDALRPTLYLPVDISHERLASAAAELQRDYDWLQIQPICADYSRLFELPDIPYDGRRLAFFPGSSIGNFEPDQAVRFLGNVASLVGMHGHLLIGIDLKKDTTILERAYDDVQGLTAAFNRNLLHHINAALGADFDPEAFDHRARYNPRAGRIEIHLVSQLDQMVRLAGRRIRIRAGEAIHTENSYKYHAHEFDELAADAGFRLCRRWTDARRWFCVALYEHAAV